MFLQVLETKIDASWLDEYVTGSKQAKKGAMQPKSLKLTFKVKGEKPLKNSTTVDHLGNRKGESNSPDRPDLPGSIATGSHDIVDYSAAKGLENCKREDGEKQADNSQYQLVLYEPTANCAGEVETAPDSIGCGTSLLSRQHPSANRALRGSPSIGAFTVQCANCFKWRLIPTKEKYEEIREHIVEEPFYCETGREWRPEISCDDPPDITQDGSRLWAIDKPNIRRPPAGWQRILRIRGEGGTKFADVYYTAPSGKRLRSFLEVQRYLDEQPQYVEQGVDSSKFSFQIPRPLQENYVQKRTPRPPKNVYGVHETREAFHPVKVLPLAWVSSDIDPEMQLGRAVLTEDCSGSPNSTPGIHQLKKRTPSKRRSKMGI